LEKEPCRQDALSVVAESHVAPHALFNSGQLSFRKEINS
jgi:hypothetical protein